MDQVHGINIAYADDHDIVRKGIGELINSFADCNVHIEVSNGQELIDAMEQSAILPDICLLDIFMPVMNGLEALIQIRKRWPDMKVLVLTGHNTDYYLIQMIRAGANGFMQKNCSPKELEIAIKSVHEHGIFHSDIMTYKFFHSVMMKEINLPSFTENEIEFLKYCCSDLSYAQIASKMDTTARSVDWFRNSLFKKLNVGSRSGLVMFAIQFGLIKLDIDNTANSVQLKKQP